MTVKLSRIERWILSNQYKILEKVDPAESEYYAKMLDVIESGYELEYGLSIDYIYRDEDCLSSAQCEEVLDILLMYQDLKHSYEDLEDKASVDGHWIEFPGFDGNTEATLLGYCQHVCRAGGLQRFPSLRRGRDNFNSHVGLLAGYRRMLAVWKPLRNHFGRGLTGGEMTSIVNEIADPDSPMGWLRDVEVEGPAN